MYDNKVYYSIGGKMFVGYYDCIPRPWKLASHEMSHVVGLLELSP